MTRLLVTGSAYRAGILLALLESGGARTFSIHDLIDACIEDARTDPWGGIDLVPIMGVLPRTSGHVPPAVRQVSLPHCPTPQQPCLDGAKLEYG